MSKVDLILQYKETLLAHPLPKNERSSKNKTLTLSVVERVEYKNRLVYIDPAKLSDSGTFAADALRNKTLCADLFGVLDKLPRSCADLLIIDPRTPGFRKGSWSRSQFSCREIGRASCRERV